MQARFIDDAVKNDRRIKPFTIVCKSEAEITWFKIPNTEWTDAVVQRRIREAKTWYDKYCIHLTFSEFTTNPNNARHRRIKAEIDKLVLEYNALVGRIPEARIAGEGLLFDTQAKLDTIEAKIRRIIGRKQMLIFFLDEWYVKTKAESQHTWRESRVSAVKPNDLTLGIDRYDNDLPANRSSRNILTHELTHALRHIVKNNAARACRRDFARVNGVTREPPRAWHDHYAGLNQDQAMSRPNRTRAFRHSYNPSSDVLSVAEYMYIQQAGYVDTKPGCDCRKEKEKKEKRKPKNKKRRKRS